MSSILEDFYRFADWSPAAAAYTSSHGLDMEVVNAHAGLLAVLPCSFDGRGFFNIDLAAGEQAIVIECLAEDLETTIDLVAWPTMQPEKFATAWGSDALGIDQIDNPATWALRGLLRVHRTPLAWLRANCEGCVPLSYRNAPAWLGKALGTIAAEDEAHARLIYQALNPRFNLARIRYPRSEAERRPA